MDYGTPEANEKIKAAYIKLNSGQRTVIAGFQTLDGHSCRAIMRRVGDEVVIESYDTTPEKMVAMGGVTEY